MEYTEIKSLKQSEKSTVLLVREKDGEQVFVKKELEGEHRIFSELLNCPHPYLPMLYDVEITDSSTTIIEEYIEGQPLGSVELPEKQLLDVVKELCSVLEFLHGKGIIHRDIKPSNIIIAKDGHIRLIDFDAARMRKDDLEQDTKLLGTRGYAPPEQYGFAQTDARADIYALGVTLEQLLGSRFQKPRYRRIIRRCTNVNPDKRYQSARQVRLAFSSTQRNILYGSIAVLLIALILYIPFRPLQHEEAQTPSAPSNALPAPGNPHWDGDTGIAVWDNVPESGSNGMPAYAYRLYRFDTTTPPAPDQDGSIMQGNMYGNGAICGIRGDKYVWNMTDAFEENGFYYFTVSAEGDGANNTNSPFVVSDAFEYTGATAPLLPTPTGLEWIVKETENGLEYYATLSNPDDYIDTDSFKVMVYDEHGDIKGWNIWTKEMGSSGEFEGIMLTDSILGGGNGRYRFTIQALTSRANEYRSTIMPYAVPEEYYSPWLEVDSRSK